jgi:hypothetical protein
MNRRSALFLFLGASLLLGAGCSGDGDSGEPSDRPARDENTVDDGKRDDSRQRDVDGKDPEPGECNCDPEQICVPETGECIVKADLPEGELYGEIELLRRVFEESKSDRVGMATVRFLVYATPPTLSLQEYYTDDNELCLLYDDDDYADWPQGRTLDAGEIALTVDGAEGPIVLQSTIDKRSGNADYWVTDPPDVGVARGHFAEEYIPYDATFTIEAAGGADIGAFTFDAGRTPEEFEIDPKGELTDDGDLIVRWDSHQSAATMEIVLSNGPNGYFTCTVRDDGEAKIPAMGSVSVQLRRTTARLVTVDADGKELKLLVQARHSRTRDLCFEDCDGSRTGAP